jgi:GNAT superfamily N-acetyltransferase
MFTIAPLDRTNIAEILATDGGPWWRRDELHWVKCLEEQARGHRSAVVASDAGGIAGYGYLNWHSQYPRFRARAIPEISDLRVSERRRRLGVATGMITHFVQTALDAGRQAIGIGVGLYKGYGPAQRLYAKLGFRPDGHGITYGNTDIEPGAMVTVDDSLVLWLVRELTPAVSRDGPPE